MFVDKRSRNAEKVTKKCLRVVVEVSRGSFQQINIEDGHYYGESKK